MSEPSPKTYSALVRDRRVSNGAFRLWHLLHDYANADGSCWPGTRRLEGELLSDHSRIAKWRGELTAAGYLVLGRRPGNGGATILYQLRDGCQGEDGTIPTQGEDGTIPTQGEDGTIPAQGAKGADAFRKGADAFRQKVRVIPSAKLNPLELNPVTEGEAPPIFAPLPNPLFQREGREMIEFAKAEIKAVGGKAENWETVLTKEAGQLMDFLKKEHQNGYQQRLDEVLDNPASFRRVKLLPGPAAIVQAWKTRIAAIKRAVNGVRDK